MFVIIELPTTHGGNTFFAIVSIFIKEEGKNIEFRKDDIHPKYSTSSESRPQEKQFPFLPYVHVH